MSDAQLVIEILSQVLASTKRILNRFKPVESVSFFLDAEAVFDVCRVNLPDMIPVLEQMLAEVRSAVK